MVLPVFFYLLLIFLFSFLSFLFVSLPSFPHPTPHTPTLFSFFFFYWTLFLCPSTIQGIPQAVLPPLPKRPALEKTNGATAVFNTGIFQYQQALANMQLQQHTAFLPPGKCCLFASRGGRRGVPNQHAGQQPRVRPGHSPVRGRGRRCRAEEALVQGGWLLCACLGGWAGVLHSNIKISIVLCHPKSELEISSLLPLCLD